MSFFSRIGFKDGKDLLLKASVTLFMTPVPFPRPPLCSPLPLTHREPHEGAGPSSYSRGLGPGELLSAPGPYEQYWIVNLKSR